MLNFVMATKALLYRAGWKVTAIDTSDANWWKGKSAGKIGLFPANYVERINPGEKAWQVSNYLLQNSNKTELK